MARTPNNSPRISRASPATVGKITKKNNNLFTNLKVESDASKSIVSSICTPKRMTRSVARATHEEMPPPNSPLHTKKRKAKTPTKKSSSTVKQENEAKKSIPKGRKSMKLFAENVATESNSEDALLSVSILVQNEPPVKKMESHIDAAIVKNEPLAEQSSGKKVRKSKRSSNTNAAETESKLNVTFEMETEIEENDKGTDLSSACKPVAINPRISLIDLTESPAVVQKASPLANIPEENEVKLNDETFTEEKANPKVQIIRTSPTPPKSTKKASPKSKKRAAPQLKRLQVKTPIKINSLTKSQTPINGILKRKPMSSAKKAKVLEAAKDVIKENVNIKSIGSAKETPLKIGDTGSEKSTPFRFGTTENRGRGFNFSLVSKIPTWKELEKQKKQVKNTKSATKSIKKAVPNFRAIHERMFEKDLALNDVQNHKSKRAEFIMSNKKVTNEENIFKPAVPKSKRKLNLNNAQAKVVETKKPKVAALAKPAPLKNSTLNNRARLNAEQREERRKMMFKQGGERRKSTANEQKFQIKGVRTNRRFDLMMENRFKSKN